MGERKSRNLETETRGGNLNINYIIFLSLIFQRLKNLKLHEMYF